MFVLLKMWVKKKKKKGSEFSVESEWNQPSTSATDNDGLFCLPDCMLMPLLLHSLGGALCFSLACSLSGFVFVFFFFFQVANSTMKQNKKYQFKAFYLASLWESWWKKWIKILIWTHLLFVSYLIDWLKAGLPKLFGQIIPKEHSATTNLIIFFFFKSPNGSNRKKIIDCNIWPFCQ